MSSQNLIFLQRFSGDCIPVLPLIGLLLYSYGLSLGDVSLFFLILALSVVVSEIPTGYLTDRTSAKLVLVLSRLFKLGAFVLLFFMPNPIGAYLAAALWGISTAADSGAFQSYLYRLNNNGREGLYEKVYSQSLTASLVGLLVGAGIASQVAILGFDGLQLIGIVILVVSLGATIVLPQIAPAPTEARVSKTAGKQLDALWQLPTLLILLLGIGALAGGIKGSLDEYTAIMLADKTEFIALVGYFIFALEVIKTTGALIAGRLKISQSTQAIILLGLGVAFILIANANIWLAFVLLVLVLLFDAMLWVHNDASIQHLATDRNRATLASYKNFGTEIIGGILFATVWLLGDNLSISLLYQASGAILVLGGVTIWLFMKPLEKSY